MLYWGHEDNQHHEEVPMILRKGIKKVTAGVETSQQSSDDSQAKRKAHQHHTDPVLRPNK